MNDQPVGKIVFRPPKWRVIRLRFDDLEKEIRKRQDYELRHVTQTGELYTLFFQAKESSVGREQILRENQ